MADGWSETSSWSGEEARQIRRTRDNVVPSVDLPTVDPAAGLHVWDSWLLRNRHGEVATVDGWRVLFSLSTADELLPGKRHDVAEIRYFYSRDGRDWEAGGRLFDSASGQRQWAGSALYDDGDLYVYYTATGDGGEELTYTQRIAVAHSGTLQTSATGVRVDGPWTHEVLLEPDGSWYETEQQSRGMTYTFRDPWFYEDPATGETYLLFEANTPVPVGSDRCHGNEVRQEFNGCVGIAASPTGDPLDWELRPPLVDAVCVNQELERPHVIRRDGRYYLFVSSHRHTFAPGFDGLDGLYGFVADSLLGEYRPLNDSGLVVTNPPDLPYQSYSWMAIPHETEVLVQSFLNYFDFGGESLDAIADLPDDEQRRRFGGTLGPTLRLELAGAETRLRELLSHWHLPTREDALPPLGDGWRFAGTADDADGKRRPQVGDNSKPESGRDVDDDSSPTGRVSGYGTEGRS